MPTYLTDEETAYQTASVTQSKKTLWGLLGPDGMTVIDKYGQEYKPGRFYQLPKYRRRKTIMIAILRWFFMGLLFAGLGMVVATAQESIDFPAPIYWDANTESDIENYGVYRSDVPCVDPLPAPLNCIGFALVATVSQGTDPIQWTEPGPVVFTQDVYYRVTARNTSGLESTFSNELNLRWLNPNAPAPPGDLRKEEQGATMFLDWDDDELIAVWRIYKSTAPDKRGGLLAHTSESQYRDVNPGRVGPRYYTVTGVNDDGEEGPPSGPVIYFGKSLRKSGLRTNPASGPEREMIVDSLKDLLKSKGYGVVD